MTSKKDAKLKKQQTTSDNKIIKYFMGLSIGVVLRDVKTKADQSLPIVNVTIEGVLLDADDTHLYLGNDEMEITSAICKSSVAMILTSATLNGEQDITLPAGSVEQ